MINGYMKNNTANKEKIKKVEKTKKCIKLWKEISEGVTCKMVT